jgi:hypothetical protein
MIINGILGDHEVFAGFGDGGSGLVHIRLGDAQRFLAFVDFIGGNGLAGEQTFAALILDARLHQDGLGAHGFGLGPLDRGLGRLQHRPGDFDLLAEFAVVELQEELSGADQVALVGRDRRDAPGDLGADDGLHLGFEGPGAHDFRGDLTAGRGMPDDGKRLEAHPIDRPCGQRCDEHPFSPPGKPREDSVLQTCSRHGFRPSWLSRVFRGCVVAGKLSSVHKP